MDPTEPRQIADGICDIHPGTHGIAQAFTSLGSGDAHGRSKQYQLRRSRRTSISQIADLHNLSHNELRSLWTTLYGTQPPAYNRVHLIKRLAYRIQELAYGGLSDTARAKMGAILESSGLDENAGEPGGRRRRAAVHRDGPVAGTRLVREWNGREYEVTCVHGGYEYDGRLYRSLTAVTKAITGTHWNGRAFFGWRSPRAKKQTAEANAIEG